MNVVNPYCSRCGAPLESDCDFCPACGTAKAHGSQASAPTREPHAWLQTPAGSTAPANSGSLVQSPPQPQIQYVPYAVQAPVPIQNATTESGLPVTVRTMGIVALSLTLVGLVPCLGWLNYFNFAFSFVTFVLAIVAIASARSDAARTSAILGLVFVLIANVIGVFRLILGGGCL